MNALTANEAKTQFGDLLLKVQRSPVQINKNGKPVAVVISMDEYEHFESMKLQLLRTSAQQANEEISNGTTIDGNVFFNDLQAGKFD